MEKGITMIRIRAVQDPLIETTARPTPTLTLQTTRDTGTIESPIPLSLFLFLLLGNSVVLRGGLMMPWSVRSLS